MPRAAAAAITAAPEGGSGTEPEEGEARPEVVVEGAVRIGAPEMRRAHPRHRRLRVGLYGERRRPLPVGDDDRGALIGEAELQTDALPLGPVRLLDALAERRARGRVVRGTQLLHPGTGFLHQGLDSRAPARGLRGDLRAERRPLRLVGEQDPSGPATPAAARPGASPTHRRRRCPHSSRNRPSAPRCAPRRPRARARPSTNLFATMALAVHRETPIGSYSTRSPRDRNSCGS